MTKNRSDGEGSIYQIHAPDCPRTPGCKCKWKGALVLGYQGEKAQRKTVTAATRSGAATRLRELRETHAADHLPAGRPVTLEKWMRHWLAQIAPRKTKPQTIETYRKHVESYIVPLLGRHRLDHLGPDHIDAAWDQLLEEGSPSVPDGRRRPLAPNTVHMTHTILRRALKVAVQRKRITRNPAGTDSMDAPPRHDKEIEPIPMEEAHAILDAVDGTPYGARWSVALALGLRPSEALGLRWVDVDLDAGTLRVEQAIGRLRGKGLVFGPPKSEAGRRSMAIPGAHLARLKTHRKMQAQARLAAGDQWADTGLVFTLDDGRAIDPNLDRKRWTALLVDLGLPHRRLYDARHSAATLMLAEGIELRTAMALLGHSQISMTIKYQHAVDSLKVDAAARIDEAWRR